MSGADSTRPARLRPIDPADVTLMRKMTFALVGLAVLAFAFSRLVWFYGEKFYDVTGRAEWIWDRHRIAAGDPLAFFAVREFDLPAGRVFTHLKVAADPEYTVWFNGTLVGGRRSEEQFPLDVYDVTDLARTGKNRVVAALRSANGVGGFIASVDTSKEAQNVVVTGRDWRITRNWDEALPLRAVAGPLAPPMLLGRPPMRRWDYLAPLERPLQKPASRALGPAQRKSFRTALAEIRVVEGVAVTAQRAVDAEASDFGFVQGRLRLTVRHPDPRKSQVIRVQFANAFRELDSLDRTVQTYVVAAGERTIVDPEVRKFRYVAVFEGTADAAVDVP